MGFLNAIMCYSGMPKKQENFEKGKQFPGFWTLQEFIEKHGGDIWVEGKEGVESEFKFSLPLS